MLFRHLLYQLSYLAVSEVAKEGVDLDLSQGDFSIFIKFHPDASRAAITLAD